MSVLRYSVMAGWIAAAACGGGTQTPDAAPPPPPPVDAAVDLRAPAISLRSPPPGAVDVSSTTTIVVVFDEPIAPVSVTSTAVRLTDGSGEVTVAMTSSQSAVQLTPAAPLAAHTSYTVTVSTDITDLAGNHLAGEDMWSFAVGEGADITPPQVIYVEPAPSALDVAQDAEVRVFFDEIVASATIDSASVNVSVAGVPLDATLEIDATGVELVPVPQLVGNAEHTGTITTAVTDLVGNHLAADYVWTFQTVTVLGQPFLIEPFAESTVVTSGRADDTGGSALALIRAGGAGGGDGYVVRRSEEAGWELPTDCEQSGSQVVWVDIAGDGNGRVHALWVERTVVGVETLHAARYVPGVGWEPTVMLDDQLATSPSSLPQISTSRLNYDYAAAAWLRAGAIALRIYDPITRTWGDVQILPRTGTIRDLDVIAGDTSSAFVGWAEEPDAVHSKIWRVGFTSPDTWGTVTAFGDNGNFETEPRFAGERVAWVERPGGTGNPEVWAKPFASGTPKKMDDVAVTAENPRIAFQGSAPGPLVTWTRDGEQVMARIFRNGSWEAAVVLDAGPDAGGAMPADSFQTTTGSLVAWYRLDASGYAIRVARRDPTLGWQASSTIDISYAATIIPTLWPFTTSSGHELVVWSGARDPATVPSVWAADLLSP